MSCNCIHKLCGYSLSDFTFVRNLSAGAQGQTSLRKGKDGKIYCFKTLTAPASGTLPEEKFMFIELRSPFLVDLLHCFLVDGLLSLCMEYCEGGSLHDLLESNTEISDEDILFIFVQLAHGLNHLHGKSIIHRDIKPGNIVLTSRTPPYRVKYCDFGVSKQVENTMARTFIGTFQFMAPEVVAIWYGEVAANHHYTPAVDIWSLGVVLYLLKEKRFPFKNPNEILSGNIPVSNHLFADIISKLLVFDVSTRITAQHLVNLPQIQKVFKHYFTPKPFDWSAGTGSEVVKRILTVDSEFRFSGLTDKDDLIYFNKIYTRKFDNSLPVITINKAQRRPTVNNFAARFYSKFSFLRNISMDNLLIAGGSIQTVLYNSNTSVDVDVFIFGIDCKQKATDRVNRFITELRSSGAQYVQREPFVITITGQGIPECQVILRLYKSKSEILHGFDLGSCQVGFDGKQLYTTSLYRLSYTFSINIVDTTRRSVSYEHRLTKYLHRGFGIVLPNLNMNKVYALRSRGEFSVSLPFLTFYLENLRGKEFRQEMNEGLSYSSNGIVYRDINFNSYGQPVSITALNGTEIRVPTDDFNWTDYGHRPFNVRTISKKSQTKCFNPSTVNKSDSQLVLDSNLKSFAIGKNFFSSLQQPLDRGPFDIRNIHYYWGDLLEREHCCNHGEDMRHFIHDSFYPCETFIMGGDLRFSNVRLFFNVVDPFEILEKYYGTNLNSQQRREYFFDVRGQQFNALVQFVKQQVIETRKCLPFITENPGTQLTSSINPIFENPENWYGEFYQEF
ncbi:hypothetical protein RCL1_004971 [Eukaryota sp. TZLM3-RCL]